MSVQELEKKMDACKTELLQEINKLNERHDAMESYITPEHLEFLAQKVEEQRERIKFWRQVRINVTSAGLWGTIVIVCLVGWWTINQFIKHVVAK